MPIAPLFWIVALLLVAAVVAAIVWPLLRKTTGDRSGGEAGAATSVYRDQKRQLDDEFAAGAISAEERDAAIEELAARLSAELDAAPSPAENAGPAASSRARIVWALALVVTLPVAAGVLYATLGNPDAMQAMPGGPGAQAPASPAQINAMVDQLAARMKSNPNDPNGWILLGRSYAVLGRFQESADAYRHAAALSPSDAGILADWADSLAMANGQNLEGEPTRLIERSLAIDPNNPKALALSGSAAAERRDFPAAIAAWRKLKAQLTPGTEPDKEVDQMIAEAETAQAGGAPPAGASAPTGPADVPDKGGAPPAPASAPLSQADLAASAITGRVSLDPKLAGRVSAGDTLYIFARAANGPRMPLAVIKESADALPRDFTLDDSMAMAPSARLSTAGPVIVEARISKSGAATPSAGDLRGVSGPVKPGTHGVDIVIGEVVR
ncbi:MAG: c-type cytochrome biogenesis protein CcmI [Casimicrobiaceae bacterium]